jgi:thiol-disulfide isomerase/thioredoxin
MVKDSRKYAAAVAGGSLNVTTANLPTRRCTTPASCHETVKARDFVFNRYAPQYQESGCHVGVQTTRQIDVKTSARALRAPTSVQARQRGAESGRELSMKTNKLLVAAVLATAIGVPIAGFAGEMKGQSMTSTGVRVPFLHGLPTGQSASQTELASLERADEWLNSPPLTPSALRGKVVLIDFWTYTCINWRRTLPYVRAWAEKYRDQGLVVIGVHAPEFSFEKNLNNVRWAVKDMRIDYPIAVDNDHVVWRAFRNQYWPALYFIDSQGRVRHHHFGEGSYEQSEMIIQELLREAGAGGVSREPVKVDARGLDAAADWGSLKSPENYVGFERTENFASPGGAVLDKPRTYELPARLRLNEWALSGDWTVKKDTAVVNKASGSITYRFHARDLHLVMGPAAPGTSVRFRVLIDGQPPSAAHGVDVDELGNGTVTEQRLYQLIRQPKPIADRRFEIEFFGSGVEAFAFTFG